MWKRLIDRRMILDRAGDEWRKTDRILNRAWDRYDRRVQRCDFKYSIGDKVILTGLIDYPEDNGNTMTISGFRRLPPNRYCLSGRAYYFEEKIGWADWIYEERLRLYM